MAYRKFTDREGNAWEIRERSSSEWSFEPIAGNSKPAVSVARPGYEADPFELSHEECQRLLDANDRGRHKARKSPFAD